MSRIPTPTGQNVRLLVVIALAGIAALTTMANAAGRPSDPAAPAPSAGSAGSAAAASSEPPSSVFDATPADATDATTVTTEDAQPSSTTADPGGIGVVAVGGGGANASLIDITPNTESDVNACSPLEVSLPAVGEVEDGSFYRDSFETADAWEVLSGSWAITEDVYQQGDSSGYDLITQLRVDPPEEYRFSVSVEALGDGLGGGVVLAQPRPSDRSGATVVDFTDGGAFLRWGRYDGATGQYQYIGGVSMVEGFDSAAPHELTVDVRKERTMVLVDGVEAGTFEPLGFGRIGLVTSRSAVAFDDVEIVEVGS